jgi:leader peptidase (prepilin peptidase)/N-methyltransferase
MEILIFALFGLIIGSFLSVCVYRIPLGRPKSEIGLDSPEEDEPFNEAEAHHDGKRTTVAYPPRSFCTSCKKELWCFHNIPCFSWLFLGGKYETVKQGSLFGILLLNY